MKIAKLSGKLKSKIRKHYVRKKDFEVLAKEVKRLKKKLAKLEEAGVSVKAEEKPVAEKAAKPAPKPAKKPVAKAAAKPAKAKAKAAPATASTSSAVDKLTRIRGIGPVLEKKLLGLGITSFSQIAAWSEKEIDSVSEHLSFKGRIQREEWIKQAKELMQ